MVFKQIKKRKLYKTWVYNDKQNHIEYYIYLISKDNKEIYHFTIHSNYFKYSSLVCCTTYDTFDNCVEAIQNFRKNNNLVGKQLESDNLYK
jgi:hypothetical protein